MSLFFRTYLAFIGAILLVGAVFVAVSEAFQVQPLPERWHDALIVLRLGEGEMIQSQQTAALERMAQTMNLDIEVLPESTNRPLAQQALHLPGTIVEDRLHLTAALAARDAYGRHWVVLVTIPGGLIINLSPFVVRTLAATLATLLIFALLARSVTGPTVALRKAAARVAAGDFAIQGTIVSAKRRDELGELVHDFETMASQLAKAREAQVQLLGDISHELRSPLARLSVALELARAKAGPEAASAMARIERESGRMNALIGELMTLSRLEAGMEQTSDETVDLSTLVTVVGEDADFEAQARGCRVALTVEAGLVVRGSSELLRRAVENVVRNALRYTQEGTAVELSLRTVGKERQVTVRDHGPGVPEVALAQLFLPFWRVGTDRDRASGGIGLGLAIADRALRLHGGSITAENAFGGGLLMTLRLPVEREADGSKRGLVVEAATAYVDR